MEFAKLDAAVKNHLEVGSAKKKIILESVTTGMKTVVISVEYLGIQELWLFQSSDDFNGIETEVDCIRLPHHELSQLKVAI